MKNVIKLENYYLPEKLEQKIQEFVNYYNNERYHKTLNNLTPADVYFSREKEILLKNKKIHLNFKTEIVQYVLKSNNAIYFDIHADKSGAIDPDHIRQVQAVRKAFDLTVKKGNMNK